MFAKLAIIALLLAGSAGAIITAEITAQALDNAANRIASHG